MVGGKDSPKMSDPKERFFRHFQADVTIIQDQINDLATISAVNGERKDCTDTILAGISRLNSEVIDAGDYIPAYDQRAYSQIEQAIKGLTEKLNETTGKFKPKSRFQFKPRTQKPAATTEQPAADPRLYNFSSANQQNLASPTASSTAEDDATQKQQQPSKDYNEELRADASPAWVVRRPSFSQAKSIALREHAGLRIALPASATSTSSSSMAIASLSDLDRCVVDMTAPTAARPLAALALKNVRRSLVVAGRVDGAVHVTGVSDAAVVVVARQVRIHECRGVDVYLRCASHPIIEDCEGMRFAPVPAAYQLPDDEQSQKASDQWDQVDDFKWLKSEPSPNWCVLPENKRIPETVWRDVLAGSGVEDAGGDGNADASSSNSSAEEILRKVGVLGRDGA
ncbi:hypothetical protein SLS62_002659 [Diatrype stigma]|uniref:C-CAP/cofactor C-like domain-containing protein n=1 Tax=Diatrype stigma TaxID=117547 RepID=A0AAN9UXL8_9PEZI